MTKRTPSKFQQAIYNWVQNGTGNAIVQAVAGSGKTTTALECMNLIPTDKSICFLAFNKSIADELKARAPRHADVATLNGLGHRAWGRFAGKITLDTDKTRNVMFECMSDFECKTYGAAVRKLVSLAKAYGLVPKEVKNARSLVEDKDETWLGIVEDFDIDCSSADGKEASEKDVQTVIDLARRVLTLSCEIRHMIDFDDQLYLTVAFGVKPPQYDWVFVDEAQDLSPVQQALVMSAVKRNGRVVAVGDEKQAIYRFRGADSDSMANFGKMLNATPLALSICYRCPKSHIALAKNIVPQIEAADTAIEGEIHEYGAQWDGRIFTNEDLIICRKTAPLVRAAYKLLAQRVAVRILGRDLGSGLVSLIRKLKASNLNVLVEKLERWRERETEKLLRKNPEANTDKVQDRFETIMTFIDMFPNHSPESVCREIEQIYSDKTKGILTLATVHKAKGLEANRVFVLNRGLMPMRARNEAQRQQEINLEYIAYTRSRNLLGFIEIEEKRD